MNEELQKIPDRILGLAVGALAQANTHAVFLDPGNEHWGSMSVLNAAHACELFIKAIIAKEHPLLIFKDLFSLNENQTDELELSTLLRKGRTHDFEKLPHVLWVTTGNRIPNPDCFEGLRKTRNSIQHFCAPDEGCLGEQVLEFIYTIIDPLIYQHFGLYAIEHHEDHSVGYDYVVAAIIQRQLRFSIPDNFSVSEINLQDILAEVDLDYREWFEQEMQRVKKCSNL